MQQLSAWLSPLLGLGAKPEDLSALQVSLRGIIVFLVALVLVRLSDRRSLTKKSPFAIVLLVVIASVLARSINGSGPFVPTLVGVIVIVLLHRLLAIAIFRWPAFAKLVKGNCILLVQEGKMQWVAMRRKSVSEADIREDLRLNAKTEALEDVEKARLEVSGDVSFVMKDSH